MDYLGLSDGRADPYALNAGCIIAPISVAWKILGRAGENIADDPDAGPVAVFVGEGLQIGPSRAIMIFSPLDVSGSIKSEYESYRAEGIYPACAAFYSLPLGRDLLGIISLITGTDYRAENLGGRIPAAELNGARLETAGYVLLCFALTCQSSRPAAAGVSCADEAANAGPRKGYRAVSDAELADINGTKSFRPDPGGRSMKDKWFSESRQGAGRYRKIFPEQKHIVEADVPQAVYDKSFKHPNVDGTGPGFAVPPEELPKVRPSGQ